MDRIGGTFPPFNNFSNYHLSDLIGITLKIATAAATALGSYLTIISFSNAYQGFQTTPPISSYPKEIQIAHLLLLMKKDPMSTKDISQWKTIAHSLLTKELREYEEEEYILPLIQSQFDMGNKADAASLSLKLQSLPNIVEALEPITKKKPSEKKTLYTYIQNDLSLKRQLTEQLNKELSFIEYHLNNQKEIRNIRSLIIGYIACKNFIGKFDPSQERKSLALSPILQSLDADLPSTSTQETIKDDNHKYSSYLISLCLLIKLTSSSTEPSKEKVKLKFFEKIKLFLKNQYYPTWEDIEYFHPIMEEDTEFLNTLLQKLKEAAKPAEDWIDQNFLEEMNKQTVIFHLISKVNGEEAAQQHLMPYQTKVQSFFTAQSASILENAMAIFNFKAVGENLARKTSIVRIMISFFTNKKETLTVQEKIQLCELNTQLAELYLNKEKPEYQEATKALQSPLATHKTVDITKEEELVEDSHSLFSSLVTTLTTSQKIARKCNNQALTAKCKEIFEETLTKLNTLTPMKELCNNLRDLVESFIESNNPRDDFPFKEIWTSFITEKHKELKAILESDNTGTDYTNISFFMVSPLIPFLTKEQANELAPLLVSKAIKDSRGDKDIIFSNVLDLIKNIFLQEKFPQGKEKAEALLKRYQIYQRKISCIDGAKHAATTIGFAGSFFSLIPPFNPSLYRSLITYVPLAGASIFSTLSLIESKISF